LSTSACKQLLLVDRPLSMRIHLEGSNIPSCQQYQIINKNKKCCCVRICSLLMVNFCL
jgi:hypothetical protein